MSAVELSIWAALLGALLTFFAAALADAIRNPTLAAFRAIYQIVLTGSTAMIMSGWVEYVMQLQQHTWLVPAKVVLGPFSSALALLYLGIWLGKLTEDVWLDRLIRWGSLTGFVVAVTLLLCVVLWPERSQLLLQISFAITLALALSGIGAAARSIALGDRLALGMLAACLCAFTMVIGLYSKGLGLTASYVLWALTAMGTAAYFLITTVLTIQRNRQRRLIARMSEGVAKADEITGLPVGGTLLSKIDDAIWRSVRSDSQCAVVGIWIDNLYIYHDEIDSSIEHEIRHVLAARIRRAIGFRYTLGLMQSRCFITGISAVGRPQRVSEKFAGLVLNLQKPILVGVMQGQSQSYQPKIGIGIVFVGEGHMTDPLSAMDHAQSLAKKAMLTPACCLSEDASHTSYVASHKSAPGSSA